MAEKENGELLSTLLGEQGTDALQMLTRMERLKRLMGTPAPQEKSRAAAAPEEIGLLARNRHENMISAAIPFLDQEYQKDIYVVVRLMEMRRVLGEEWVEAREKQTLSPKMRRRQMLAAIRPYLAQPEQEQMAKLLKMLEIREIMMESGGTE